MKRKEEKKIVSIPLIIGNFVIALDSNPEGKRKMNLEPRDGYPLWRKPASALVIVVGETKRRRDVGFAVHHIGGSGNRIE